MSSIVPGFLNDVLISHSEVENTDRDEGWMTALAGHIQEKLETIFERPMSVVNSSTIFDEGEDELQNHGASSDYHR